jgi:nickel-dependent lactate racemase
MTISATDKMFEGVPHDLFRVHDWRNDVVTLGTVPAEFVEEITEGKYTHEYPVQVNKLVRDGGHDLVISIGQVVPHEVAGMANHTKNILVRPLASSKLVFALHFTERLGWAHLMVGRDWRQRSHRPESFCRGSVRYGEHHGSM